MDFWRAYRVLARRKWIIITAVALATTIAGIAVLLFGRRYEASTQFRPTDQAMRHVIDSGNEQIGQQPVLTDDIRYGEARRITYQAKDASIIGRALATLATSDVLTERLHLDLPDSPNGPNYDAVTAAVRARINEIQPGINVQTWDTDKNPGSEISKIENETSIPVALWADFVYLDRKLAYYGAPRDFLRPERLPETVARVAKTAEAFAPDSKIVLLTVRDRDPRVAEVLANAITAAYKYYYDSSNLRGSRRQVQFYQQRLNEAQRKYVRSRQVLSDWRRKNSGVFMQDQIAAIIKKGETAKDDLEKLNGNLKDLDAQIAAKKAFLASTPKMLDRTTKVEDPEVGKLREKIATLRSDLAEKRATRTENDPAVKRMADELANLQQRLGQVERQMVGQRTVVPNDDWEAMNREVANLEQARRGLAARAATANQVMAEAAHRMSQIPQASVDAQAYAQAYASASEQLSDVAKKLSSAEEDLRKADDTGALQVDSWAGLNSTQNHWESPARPNATKRNAVILLAAFMLSLLASAGIILGADFFDTSIKTPYDAEHMLDVPVNGIVPRLDGPSRASLPMVTHKLPASPHAESYRFLGTDILLSANGDDPFKSIMVATAKPGQGGTTTVCNLAITLAQAGQSVVLVDADLRRPSLHRIFGLENESGLTTVLENGRLPSDVLQRTEVENLYVMTGGPQTENAWKLLRSAKMKDVIMDLSRDFDFVLFDTPSAVVFADAATLATMVDGVLLVVRAHETPSGSELQVKNLLNKTKARIVGVVLNDMPAEQVDSARFFNHYYATAREEIAPRGAKTALPGKSHDDEI